MAEKCKTKKPPKGANTGPATGKNPRKFKKNPVTKQGQIFGHQRKIRNVKSA